MHTFSQSLPIYFYAFDLLNRNGELLVNLPFPRRRQLLESPLDTPRDPVRLSPLLQAPTGQIFEAVRNLGLEGVVGKRIDPSTNLESDQARGSSTARTWSRSSSSAVTWRMDRSSFFRFSNRPSRSLMVRWMFSRFRRTSFPAS